MLLRNNNIDMKQFAIYTAIVGKYDNVLQPEVIDERFDYILFSNDIPEKQVGIWKIRPFEYHNDIQTKIARWIKTHPGLLLPEYPYTIWTDANIQIKSNATYNHFVELAEKNTLIACRVHPERRSIIDEATLCAFWHLETEHTLLNWIRKTTNEKYPDHTLFETCILWRSNTPESDNFNESWWSYIDTFSRRDQLSFPYTLWEKGLTCEHLLPLDFDTDNSVYYNRFRTHGNESTKRVDFNSINFPFLYMYLKAYPQKNKLDTLPYLAKKYLFLSRLPSYKILLKILQLTYKTIASAHEAPLFSSSRITPHWKEYLKLHGPTFPLYMGRDRIRNMHKVESNIKSLRKTWSGRAILTHWKHYLSAYSIAGIFIILFDLIKLIQKPFLKWRFHRQWRKRAQNCKNEDNYTPVKLNDYVTWVDYLKITREEFVDFTTTPYTRHPEDPKIYAFHLTQYHAIPENDNAHGKGFTEWQNVANAVPQFVGHFQPKIPYDLGFYNLLMSGVMERQIEIAKTYGVYGFCFYYYWFSGRKLLEKPLEYFLHSNIDFHFHLCWATENWSRRWDGGKHELIVEQHLTIDDAVRFYNDIVPYFKDSRYEKIKGKPVLIIYRVDIFEKNIFEEFIDKLNNLAIQDGFTGIHILCTNAFGFTTPYEYSCQGLVEFPPHALPNIANYRISKPRLSPRGDFKITEITPWLKDGFHLLQNDYPTYKACFPGWDNTPRKLYGGGNCYIMDDSDFARWLSDIIIWTRKHHPLQEQLVYINAWNEWGEGAILEPTTRFGYKYLETLKNTVETLRKQ